MISLPRWVRLGAVCLLGMVAWQGAFAQFDLASDTLVGLSQILTLVVNLMTFLALKLIELGGKLLGTDWIIGEAAMSGIRPMWVLIRNLTNIAFVVVLVGLSFTNLFSGIAGGGEWTIKEKLPRVILALVAVNFSLVVFQVMINVVQVGTVAVISLADTSLQSMGAESAEAILNYKSDEFGNRCFTDSASCMGFADRMNEFFCTDGQGSGGCWFYIDPERAGQTTDASANANNLFLAFGVYFQQLQRLPALSAQLGLWSEVAQDVLFSSIMGLVYVVALAAIFLALLTRVVVMWVALVASPALMAGAILGAGGGDGLGGTIVKYLIMPLKIGAALAVSFVMMAAMSEAGLVTGEGAFIQPGGSVMSLGTMGFIWQVLTVVVFWTAAFWALEDAKWVSGAIEGIKNGTQALGGLVARTALLDRPLFSVKDPTGQSEKKIGMSLGSLYEFPQQSSRIWERQLDERRRKTIEDLIEVDVGTKNTNNAIARMRDETDKIDSRQEAEEMVYDLAQGMGIEGSNAKEGRKAWKELRDRIEADLPSAGKDIVREIDRELLKGGKITNETLKRVLNKGFLTDKYRNVDFAQQGTPGKSALPGTAVAATAGGVTVVNSSVLPSNGGVKLEVEAGSGARIDRTVKTPRDLEQAFADVEQSARDQVWADVNAKKATYIDQMNANRAVGEEAVTDINYDAGNKQLTVVRGGAVRAADPDPDPDPATTTPALPTAPPATPPATPDPATPPATGTGGGTD